MCEEMEKTADVTPPAAPVAPAAQVEEQIVSLWQEVESLRRELVDLRMGQRKALLEELAALENPLVEQGVIGERTRRPRHWKNT